MEPDPEKRRAAGEHSVEVVRRAIGAYNRRDFEAIRALNHDDVEVDWTASRGLEADVYHGIEEVLRFFQSFLELFEDVRIDPERFVESGGSILVPNAARMRGRDGIETAAHSVLLFEVRDERVARLSLHQDMEDALGSVSAAARQQADPGDRE